MFHPAPQDSEHLKVEISFEIGGGSGADGISLLLMRELPESTVAEEGGSVGSEITNGIAIEFDTHQNGWDSSGNHVGVDLLEQGRLTPLTAVDLSQDLRVGVFDAEVVWDGSRVKLYLSNATQQMPRTLAIDYDIPGFAPFTGYVGLIGQTGGLTDRHVIHEARLSTAQDPTTPSYQTTPATATAPDSLAGRTGATTPTG